jgi:hypothetical protein
VSTLRGLAWPFFALNFLTAAVNVGRSDDKYLFGKAALVGVRTWVMEVSAYPLHGPARPSGPTRPSHAQGHCGLGSAVIWPVHKPIPFPLPLLNEKVRVTSPRGVVVVGGPDPLLKLQLARQGCVTVYLPGLRHGALRHDIKNLN